jgi:Icc-related predicted phosphoesterase
MKILALSDQVDERVYSARFVQNYGDVDVVVGCGDLPYDYLEYVVSMLNRPVFYVHGNHDAQVMLTAEGGEKTGPEGGELLDDRVRYEQEALLLGLGGSIRYRPGAGFQYTDGQMRYRIARLLPRLLFNRVRYGRFVDVVVAHSPPFGIHDGPDPAHVGFRAFLVLMQRFRPRLLLHGHLHVARHQTTIYRETQVMGVFPMRLIDF